MIGSAAMIRSLCRPSSRSILQSGRRKVTSISPSLHSSAILNSGRRQGYEKCFHQWPNELAAVGPLVASAVILARIACDTENQSHKPAECSVLNSSINQIQDTGKIKEGIVFAKPIKNIKSYYKIGELIGEGGFGHVYRATRIRDGKILALKCISKDYTRRDGFQREIDALHKLNFEDGGHPHVCRIYDIYEGKNEYWLSLELIEGGELFEHLIEKGAYSEAMAAIFLRQFAEALSFMHAAGVVHADLKPENLMLSSWDDEKAELKLVDFGCSVILDKKSSTSENPLPSTFAYDPPEKIINDSPPTFSSDVWAAGCILYIILTGSHPFDKSGTSTDEEIVERIKSIGSSEEVLANLIFDERTRSLSPSVISLLWYMLHPDPEKRTTSERFRRNRWVQGLTASWQTLEGIDEKLENYWQKEFRQKIFKKFHATLGLGEIATDDQLKEVFEQIDEDGNGQIDVNELTKVLESVGVKKKDITSIFDAINLTHLDGISLDDFKAVLRNELPVIKNREYYQKRFQNVIARAIRTTHKSTEPESLNAAVRRLFFSMDLDKNGALDCHELRVLLRQIGVDEKEISFLVASVDLDKDGSLSYEEFSKIILGARKKTLARR